MQVISQKMTPTNIELIIDPLNQTKIKKKIKNHSIYPQMISTRPLCYKWR